MAWLLCLAILLIFMPLWESWYGVTLWGLNLYSPAHMDVLADYLRPVKIVLVCAGVFLLTHKAKAFKAVIHSRIAGNLVLAACYIFAALQIILLTLGIFFLTASDSDLGYIHQEHNLNQHTIYIHTADPGAMAKAYHYVYLKCPLPFNRYALHTIGRLNWMRKFNLKSNDNTLIFTPLNALASESVDPQTLDVGPLSCAFNNPQVL
ncbi:hypothetical protein [Thalassotalea litorea]|uniref:hypothetical protein n=1 Tax=Thalassotalea litorea TaxID=2020715 RepID=UPI0037351D95